MARIQVSFKNNDNENKLWIHLNNNDWNSPSESELTMSRRDYNVISFVGSDGNIWLDYLTSAYSVRPVFYLTSDIKITSGTGTIDNPYIIN